MSAISRRSACPPTSRCSRRTWSATGAADRRASPRTPRTIALAAVEAIDLILRGVRGARAVLRHPAGPRSGPAHVHHWGHGLSPLRAPQSPPRAQGRSRVRPSTPPTRSWRAPTARRPSSTPDRDAGLARGPAARRPPDVYSCTQAMYFSMGVRRGPPRRAAQPLQFVGGTVGGGFGGKVDTATEPICALLAIKSQKPVKWRFTREEEFLASSTRAPWHVEMAGRGDRADGWLLGPPVADAARLGRLLALLALRGHEALVPPRGAYTIPTMSFDGFVVCTNRVPPPPCAASA